MRVWLLDSKLGKVDEKKHGVGIWSNVERGLGE